MKFVVYIDTYFFINLFIDIILLFLLKQMVKQKSSIKRILGASIVGALGASITILFPDFPVLLRILFLYVCINSLMIVIMFGYQGWKTFLCLIFQFYMLTFLFGGIIQFLYYNGNIKSFFREVAKSRLYEKLQPFTLVILILILGVCVLPITYLYNYIRFRQENLLPIQLYFEEKSVKAYGLMDSGNMLRDPITQKPVLIAEFSLVKTLFPDVLCECIYDNLYLRNQVNYSEEKDQYARKLRLIPYHSIGKKEGMLPGIIFQKIDVMKGKNKIETQNVMVAIYDGILSEKKEYQVILQKAFL